MRKLVAGVLIVASSGLAGSMAASGSGGGSDGYLSPAYWRGRQDAFLQYATQGFSPGSITNVIANAERMRRDPSFHVDMTQVTPALYANTFDGIDTLEDTTDFTMLYFTNLWYGYRDLLTPDMRAAIEQRFHTFKYWYTEPTAPGLTDNKYYWSENHRIIYYSLAYLAGQAFPTDTFTNDGRTGAAHRDEAKQRILQWIDEKVKFGFTEWHSDVYYQKDIDPLLTLAEFANDAEIRTRASMVLDLVLADIALHLRDNNFGATHGRSYMKDKSRAGDQDTYNASKLLFDTSSEDFDSTGDPAAVMFSRAQRYRVPMIIWKIARSTRPIVDQQHMGVAIDPSAPVTANPAAPPGYAFDDPEAVPFWWERGAQTAWQEVETTIKTLTQYGLWTSSFYKDFTALRDLVGDDYDLARSLAQSLAPQLAFGLLSEVDSYTYRNGHVMLSTAQDYRPGNFSEQTHISQATLDNNAIVFTQSPKNEPVPHDTWSDDDGYWTGNGAMPRAAQHGKVSISIYAPTFEPSPFLPSSLSYIDVTHAYFPQENFDEVRQVGNWTFGRKGQGYVALWSYRTPHFQDWDPNVYYTHGLTQPFDLRADGGADNVWITEVGDASQLPFDQWVRTIAKQPISVTALPANGNLPGGFDVSYRSLSQGDMTFGTHAPFTVGGRTLELHRKLRFDNPYVQAMVGATRYRIHDGATELVLDFRRSTRDARGN